ncbi:hypothetical protein ERO13_D08G142500v2 [Gossypium hirsutum]|uniref:Pectinesterase n=2 Tax=Gossypium TaxID=3633 RepID=A0A1U8K091_GOSHI|nr:pectinesterase-like [Gossypium hirsutum]KAG4134206.1 hypothetical protein ERO13_D08G142500v2 [Gossypium hirsutum]TYH58500.1 hypothetical protein ES332_D08G158500v1 [Gossypium tomentosum]
MSNKVVVAGVSIILVVGVAIGVVTTINHSRDAKGKLSPEMKVATSICAPTHYPDTCQKTFDSMNSTDPKEFVKKAIYAAEEEVKKFLNFSNSKIAEAKDNGLTKMALNDCKDMMQYAIDSLEATYADVDGSDLHNIDDRINDFRTWLSAVISYQQSCLDGFEHDRNLKETMEEAIVASSEHAANALTIVTKLIEILTKLGSELASPDTRRLFSVEETNYPSWFSTTDRKLIAKIDNSNLKPNAVVAKDGSGQFKTIAEALAAAPKNSINRHIIYIKAGIYDEYITVDKQYTNILIFGDGPRRTIVAGRKAVKDGGGITTWQTATFSAIGNGFIAKSMGFQNNAGPEKHQAVALRIQSDKSAFFNCRMDGYQDTLYNHANRQFFRNCVISGTVDFIFGDSPTVIQNSLLIVRRPMEGQSNMVTAQGKTRIDENTGTVIQNCRIVPEQKLFIDRFKFPTYLGRPWKPYSTTIIMESTLGDFIRREGWMPFATQNHEDTLYYAEYNNRGPGANLDARVNWKGYHKIDKATAMKFTVEAFLHSKENWLPSTGIPFTAGLRY